MKSIKEADVTGKRVLVRTGLDAPLEGKEVVDDSRIRASVDTINFLRKNEASSIVLIAKLGRPNGKEVDELRMEPVVEKLADLLGVKGYKKEDLQESGMGNFPWDIYHLDPNIILLENIRFSPQEEENSEEFAKQLASLADIYISDDFSVIHRNEASVVAITKLLPSYAGLRVELEFTELNKILKNPDRPLGVIIGGAKTEDKLPAVKNLSTLADFFLLGGMVANTFLVARGHDIGKSKYDVEQVKNAKKIWTQIMDDPNRDIFLPRDFVISKLRKKAKKVEVIGIKDIEKLKDSNYKIVDIGPKTVKLYSKKIADSGTIFWNGNLGITEVKEFSRGSQGIAEAITRSSAYSVVGGGDTAGFINEKGLADKFNFISTGGGATLDFLAGKKLPGLANL